MTGSGRARSVAAVLVNYRAPELVSEVVAALAAGGIPAIVADNSAELRGAPFPVVDCGTNVGFGAGCNRAVAALGSDVDTICLHNPDVVPAPGSIEHLVAGLAPGVGAVAPAVRTGSAVRTRGFHGPGVAREAALAWRATRPVARVDDTGSATPSIVRGRGPRFATAALLVLDRHAYESVGGFDERFFLYGEDLDLWHRLGRAGFAPRFVDDVVVDHLGKAGSEMGRGTRELLRWLGVELFAELHRGTGWRPYRAVHRTALGRLDADPTVTGLVDRMWRAGASPSAVLGTVRRHFEAASGPVVRPAAR